MPKRIRNNFGIVYPSDDDPNWIPSSHHIDPNLAINALPIGIVVHPSGWAYMNNYPLWKQMNDEREVILQQQREQRYQYEKEQQRLKKIEEKKFKKEQEKLKKIRQDLNKQLESIQKNYQREIRQVSRGIDAEYNPQIKEIQKQLKQLNKQIE